MEDKKEPLMIHAVGTSVSLTDSVDAKIVTVAIHENNTVAYECAWWTGDSRAKDWFSLDDFIGVGEKDSVTKIGFLRS